MPCTTQLQMSSTPAARLEIQTLAEPKRNRTCEWSGQLANVIASHDLQGPAEPAFFRHRHLCGSVGLVSVRQYTGCQGIAATSFVTTNPASAAVLTWAWSRGGTGVHASFASPPSSP